MFEIFATFKFDLLNLEVHKYMESLESHICQHTC